VVFTHKEITALYKNFLEIIEDLRNDNDIMLAKVAAQCSEQFAKDINFFTSAKYEQLRKRVLDQGNECSRRLINFLDFFEFIINKDKVEDAARSKRLTTTTKKVLTSAPIEVV
jgi:hypothetical protein